MQLGIRSKSQIYCWSIPYLLIDLCKLKKNPNIYYWQITVRSYLLWVDRFEDIHYLIIIWVVCILKDLIKKSW